MKKTCRLSPDYDFFDRNQPTFPTQFFFEVGKKLGSYKDQKNHTHFKEY